MSHLVLAFSGAIASGKTSVSTTVARLLGCPRVSFGEQVRRVAEEQGLPASREQLQALGESLVREQPGDFCRAVLRQADWRPETGLVIDGVRHSEILDELRALVRPCELRLVFINADKHTRAARRPGRGETPEGLSALDAHSTERQVLGALPKIADLLVDGTRDIEVLADEIVRWVRHQVG
jgi:dephospho-CoA kinase